MSKLTRSKKWKASLSLCMIVKNESETLEKCLRYARPFVDEIVIIDTGSTDGTQEIAKRYADVYDEIEWPGSFSEARNYSLDKASGDYVLILDGDEYIESARDWKRIRRALTPGVAYLELSIVNLMGESSLLHSDRFWQQRVLRNAPEVRYEGKVHNQISPGLERYCRRTGEQPARVDAEVLHVGYSYDAERMRTKYEPRLELLEAEYEKPRSSEYKAYYGYQLAVVRSILKQPEEVIRILSEVDFRELSFLNGFYAHVLGAQAAIRLDKPALALAHCEGMLSMTRDEPVAYYLTGISLLKSRQAHDGMLMLLEAVEVNRKADRSVRFAMNPIQLLNVLASVCEEGGLPRHAEQLRDLRAENRHDDELLGRIVGLMKISFAKAAVRLQEG